MRRAALILVGALALLPATAAAGPKHRASLSDLETEVMCVLCKVPLQVAGDAPQAVAERRFINDLIAKGQTKKQIKDALVAQYGPQVLANPPANGFSLSAYLVPVLAVVAALVLLALALPRWRRRSRAPAAAGAPGAALDPADARRLDEDLARFDS
jgi:cytochrome c-type biogenesis protein CcmH/NrfF